MPMCGPRRRAYGSPHWSSSGSTEPPPSSSGLRWRTSLQSAAELDSSLSATLNLRMTGEIIDENVEIEFNTIVFIIDLIFQLFSSYIVLFIKCQKIEKKVFIYRLSNTETKYQS